MRNRAAAVVVGLGVLVAGCGGGSQASPAAGGSGGRGSGASEARVVDVVAAQQASLERTIDVTGTLAAED